jgi:hypothetical protein
MYSKLLGESGAVLSGKGITPNINFTFPLFKKVVFYIYVFLENELRDSLTRKGDSGSPQKNLNNYSSRIVIFSAENP